MAKIPFDIKFRPQIESGEYKVETRDGLPARVVCYDAEGRFPVVAMVNGFPASMYTECGCVMNNEGHGKYDLFIITPEPELTPFEDAIRLLAEEAVKEAHLHPERTSEDFAKKNAMKILEAAFKNIPRWKKCEERKIPALVWKKAAAGTALPGDSVIRYKDDDPRFGRVAIRDCEYITMADLNALPTEEKQGQPVLVNEKTGEPYCKTSVSEYRRLFGEDKETLGVVCKLLKSGFSLITPGGKVLEP